jgi:DNA-binding response OmpR family regulator
MNILIADDDVTSRCLLETVLRKLGYDVVTAGDGNDALVHMQKDGAPDLVILDWMMPGMDGIEVCRRYRAEHPNVPKYIIILTAKDSKSDTVEGLAAGANDYITKPFDNGELIARLGVGKRFVDLQKKLADRVDELKEALDHVKRLQGILPICMYCHKIRNDRKSWDRVEQYISQHSDAEFSHSICPECMEKYHPKHT